MYIKNIELYNFRCFEAVHFDFAETFNIIIGANASGKTSILEAIYFLAFTKSFRTKHLKYLIKLNSSFLKVVGEVCSSEGDKLLEVTLNSKKNMKINEEVFHKVANYVGTLKVILLSFEDINLIKGSPNYRRRFIDALFSQIDKNYLQKWREIRFIIKEKNKILKIAKKNDEKLIKSIQKLFIEKVYEFYNLRKVYLARLQELFVKKYNKIFGCEKVKIKYEYKGKMDDFSIENLAKIGDFYLRKELQYQKTLWGPHLDDLYFYVNERKAKYFSSQGQIKSIILALKMACVDFVKEKTGEIPILLIDDIFSELDEVRIELFLKNLPKIQIISTSPYLKKISVSYNLIHLK